MSDGIATSSVGLTEVQTPTIGSTFRGFINQVVRPEAHHSVETSAIEVLSKSLQYGRGSTGLVVGHVQSGKTLSYEGVICLARDNEFAAVIVISGISNPLLAQGEGRLKQDLGMADPQGVVFLSPANSQQASDHVVSELTRIRDNWRDPSTPAGWRQTAVVVVLKNHTRIRSLAEALESADLGDQRVLIIDDEADQASLNTLIKKGKKSSTYVALQKLRKALPNHYYLQYTATPQAPLLIALQDTLSPEFVVVLEPGVGYTGGEEYFSQLHQIVKPISTSDLQAVDYSLGPPPDSLKRATQEFLLGAAHFVASDRQETHSMLVHPSRETEAQGVFTGWMRSMKHNWQNKYEHSKEAEPLKLKQEFQEAWQSLKDTYPQIVSFEACWKSLGLVLRNVDITEVNARNGKTPVIEWTSTKSYILIGGQAIDRGFTVEGLTVTYMPRGVGTFTADTIQQRARFFGYKSSYLGLCRVYLEPDVRDAFVMYVEHENAMLQNLREIQSGHTSLKGWKRHLLMDSRMKPTRASVVDIPTIRVTAGDRWVTDRFPYREDAIPLSRTGPLVDALLSKVDWHKDSTGLHKVGRISLRNALELMGSVASESLLNDPNHEALALQLARLADSDTRSDAVAIYQMRPDEIAIRTKERRGGIEVFAGRTESGRNYPGDRQIYDDSGRVTIQLHRVDVHDRDTRASVGEFLISAWRIPEAASNDWIIETSKRKAATSFGSLS